MAENITTFKPRKDLGAPKCRVGQPYVDRETGKLVTIEEQIARNPDCANIKSHDVSILKRFVGDFSK